jgi:hypothetical protein
MDTKVRKLPAVRSPILIVEGLGYGDDKVAGGTHYTTVTEAKIVPGSPRAEKLAS